MPQSLDNLSTNWTSTAALTGIKFNVATDTGPSNAASRLLDLQVGGTSRFNVSKGAQPTGFSIKTDVAVEILANNSVGLQLKVLGGNNPILTIDSIGIQFSTAGAVYFATDAANTLAQRNGTNAQAFRIYNTTDAGVTNFERAKIAWSSNVLQIGTEKGGTGTARALELQTDGTTRLTIATDGAATFVGQINAGQSNAIRFNNSTTFFAPSDGLLRLSNAAANDFGRLQFGGTTSSFPALKRDTVRLQARLADDSAFTNIQGKLTADVNAVAETPTATHTITIYDAAGTGYKVLCVAA